MWDISKAEISPNCNHYYNISKKKIVTINFIIGEYCKVSITTIGFAT